MQAERLPLIALAALVAGLVALGLLAVGGPGAGRMEKRDDARLSDLQEISQYVRCVADAQGKVLPEALDPMTTCQRDLRRTDPFTDAPYRYERVSDTSYRLCAGFEGAERMSRNIAARLDPETGCLQFSYTP